MSLNFSSGISLNKGFELIHSIKQGLVLECPEIILTPVF